MTMFRRAVAADLIKLRRTFVPGLVVLGPFGVIALQAVNFTLRYDWLTKQYADHLWGGLLDNIKFLAAPALMIGIAIVASMMQGYEHQTNAWKQTLALPVSKAAVYTAKMAVLLFLLLCSCTLLAFGTVILGLLLGFGSDIPFGLVLHTAYLPLLAAMPFVSLQVWLTVVMKNQAIPLTVGILGTVFNMYSAVMPEWFPWKWPYLLPGGWSTLHTICIAVSVGAVLYSMGVAHFRMKDVK